MFINQMGLEERKVTQLIAQQVESTRLKKCSCCKSDVEYYDSNAYSDFFCPFCKSRLHV